MLHETRRKWASEMLHSSLTDTFELKEEELNGPSVKITIFSPELFI